jgi:hypothetical protein
MVVEEEKEVKWHQDSVLVILERFLKIIFTVAGIQPRRSQIGYDKCFFST